MDYRKHIKRGAVSYLYALAPISSWILYRQDWAIARLGSYWWEFLICFILCILGSMVPDVDTDSKSRQTIYTILMPFIASLILLGYYRSAAVLGLIAMPPNVFPHRHEWGPHSSLVMVVISSPLLAITAVVAGKLELQQLGASYYVALLAGHTSHVIADRKDKDDGMRSSVRNQSKIIDIEKNVRARLVICLIAALLIITWVLYKQGWAITGLRRHSREFLFSFLLFILASTVPKIDIKGIWRKSMYRALIPANSALLLLGYYKISSLIGLVAILPNVRKSRQKHYRTSALWLAAILLIPILGIPMLATGKLELYQLGVSYYIAAVSGYMSHIIADKSRKNRRHKKKRK